MIGVSFGKIILNKDGPADLRLQVAAYINKIYPPDGDGRSVRSWP